MVVPKNLDVLVSKLRKKLSLDENIKIINVHGVGYKLEVVQ
jgi:DNA-binding response OmpR family regulator